MKHQRTKNLTMVVLRVKSSTLVESLVALFIVLLLFAGAQIYFINTISTESILNEQKHETKV